MSTQHQLSTLERTRLRCALVESHKVVKAYRASLAVTTDETEKRWLQDGLRNALGRAWEHKLSLDAIHELDRMAV